MKNLTPWANMPGTGFFVPTRFEHCQSELRMVAEDTGAIPYDIPGVEYGHVGELYSFDAFLRLHHLTDPVLKDLAVIVRGADTGRPELAPQCPGLVAISLGLSVLYQDDHEMLRHGMVMYDALYAWLKNAGSESHGRPQARP